jgi:dTDP-4-amino-4,6-dideoxygalactose transaminase
MTLEVGPGDEVITTPFTFFATAGVVHRLGARPVFVDIDPRDFNVDAGRLAAAMSPRTKAIIPVHLYGQAADMDAIREVAGTVSLIEDCCQAIGTEYHGVPVGGIGAFGCFSFFPTKNLGAFGDGGLITTNDETLAEKLMDMRVHGMRPKYVHHFVGGNFRLDALQAAILRAKLPRLPGWIEGRKASAAHYRDLFGRARLGGKVRVPDELPGRGHTYHQFVVRAERRDALREHLAKLGIGAEIYYPISLHEQRVSRAGISTRRLPGVGESRSRGPRAANLPGADARRAGACRRRDRGLLQLTPALWAIVPVVDRIPEPAHHRARAHMTSFLPRTPRLRSLLALCDAALLAAAIWLAHVVASSGERPAKWEQLFAHPGCS